MKRGRVDLIKWANQSFRLTFSVALQNAGKLGRYSLSLGKGFYLLLPEVEFL